ncbi:MAG: cupin domain-containing protein [Bacteroidota bacterium]
MAPTINFIQRNPAEYVDIPGIQMNVILSTECSGGNLTILEKEVSVGAGSPPLVCNHDDKVILVTEGKFTLYANGESYDAEKGANIFIPQGIMHSVVNTGTQTGKLLITLTPGRQEKFLKDINLSVKVIGKKRVVIPNITKQHCAVLA